MTGKLYIVATPIGNLEDITLRALRLLRECNLIACEDTRQTRKLLEHFGIATPAVSYHDHNEAERAAELVEKLVAGSSLVHAAIDAGISVIPIPGPSAALSALSAAGLPSDAFRFCGFLPPKSSQRRRALEERKADDATLIFYETPHRILDALEDIEAVMGARSVVAARELTKLHEEFLRGTAAEIRAALAARPSVKGEFTILIGKAAEGAASVDDNVPLADAVRAAETEGLSHMDAIKRVAKERGLGKRDVYRMVETTAQEPGKSQKS